MWQFLKIKFSRGQSKHVAVGGSIAAALAALGMHTLLAPAQPAPFSEATTQPVPAKAMLDPYHFAPLPVRPLPPDYQILLTRSLFSTKPVHGSSDVAAAPGDPAAAPDLVLRGVASQEGRLLAFVEDQRYGSLIRLQMGDPIASGHITRIWFSGVEYDTPGAAAQIGIGYTLDGNQAASPTDATQPTDDGNGNGNGDASRTGFGHRHQHSQDGRGPGGAQASSADMQDRAR